MKAALQQLTLMMKRCVCCLRRNFFQRIGDPDASATAVRNESDDEHVENYLKLMAMSVAFGNVRSDNDEKEGR